MAADEKLTIHKLGFNIQVADKDAYKLFADRISNLCKRELPRRLDDVMKKHKIPNGNLIIKKLDINVKNIPPNSFEKYLTTVIAEEFDLYLSKYIKEITDQIENAKFGTSAGGRILVSTSDFNFESEIYLEKSVHIDKEVRQAMILDKSYKPIPKKSTPKQKHSPIVPAEPIPSIILSSLTDKTTIGKNPLAITEKPKLPISSDLSDDSKISDTSAVSDVYSVSDISNLSNISNLSPPTEKIRKNPERAISKAVKQDDEITIIEILKTVDNIRPEAKLKAVQFIKEIPADLKSKTQSELERIFLYHLRYGRLPSNIKYELGIQMLDILNINQLDIRFFNDLKKHIDRDERAKERLIRITDKANKASLIKKQIFTQKDLDQYDPRTPKSFEDYLTALLLERNLEMFSPELKRYNLNDMIRFLYADHPQKLRALLKFLLVEYPSQETTQERIKKLFAKIGKSSIVKIIGSFVRKAGYVNKSLNQLNKINKRDIKDAHEAVLLAFLLGKDPLQELEDYGFNLKDSDVLLEIRPRIFFSPEPEFKIKSYLKHELLDYFLRYGTLPHSSSQEITSIEKLSVSIFMLSEHDIRNIPYFRDRDYERNLKHFSIGQLSEKSIEHILSALVPDIAKDMMNKYRYFNINIKSGISESFQKGFLIYYALRNSPKSYLEEMVDFWKKEYGDANNVIKRRWNVNEEVEKELNKLLHTTEEKLADLIKVAPEYDSYTKDISVKNAGLVIVWPFLRVYFNMLDLLNEKGDFRSKDERARACHLLQYLAIKQSGGEELYYPLNKILTGYPLNEPLPHEITMTQKEIDVSNALLKNIIKQWNALKGSSVDALRGSFLIRNGILVPAPNGWLLTVEKKAYDILLDKLPWGIGMIKLSWAPYVLSVEWDRNIM